MVNWEERSDGRREGEAEVGPWIAPGDSLGLTIY